MNAQPPPQLEAMVPAADANGWGWAPLFSFRLLFAYFCLFKAAELPGTSALFDHMVPWTATHVFHLPALDRTPTGSGDKAVDYVQAFCAGTLSLLIAVIWSIVARSRSHPKLHALLRVAVRYLLAMTMLTYGMAKVLKSQFPTPGPDRLLQPLGDMSPMGLLWAFMGYSAAYNVFTGLGEVVGGALLLFRRTTMLGALIVTIVMGNVVALNFSYDVPLKIFSSQLLFWTGFLLAPDARRLANFFVLNQPTEPAPPREPFRTRGLEHGRLVLKVLVVSGMIIIGVMISWNSYRQWGDGAPKPRLFGAYEVEEFIWNGDVRPPLTTDVIRWKTVGVNRQGFLVARKMNGKLEGYTVDDDLADKTISLTRFWDKSFRATFRSAQPDPEHLVLEGRLGGDMLTLRLRRIDDASFVLTSRGFHWINESPLNR